MADQLTSTQRFFIGAVGGIAPAFVRGAAYLVSHDGVIPPLGVGRIIGYSLALIVFLMFGGAVALWLDDVMTKKSAFLVGVSLPSLFQVTGLQAETKTADISARFHVALISSAFAQDPLDTTLTNKSTSQRTLEISVPREQISKNLSVRFFDKAGKTLGSKPVDPGFVALKVPPDAASVQFEKDGSSSRSHPLSEADVQTTKIKVEQSSISAFKQAIGLSRNANPSIEVEKVMDARPLPLKTYGWCVIGTRGDDKWRTRLVDFPGTELPDKGTTVTAIVPITINQSADNGVVIGVVHPGQHLRIEELRAEETKNQGTSYSAAVTVVE